MTAAHVEEILKSLHIGEYAILSGTAGKIGVSKYLIQAAVAQGKLEKEGRGVITREALAKWIAATPYAAAKLCEKIENSHNPAITQS